MGVIIDNRLLDCESPSEVTENFNRVLGIADDINPGKAMTAKDVDDLWAATEEEEVND